MSGSTTRKYLHRELERSIGNALWARLHLSRCLEIFINQTLQQTGLSVDQLMELPSDIEVIFENANDVKDNDAPTQDEQDKAQFMIDMVGQLEIPERYTQYVQAIILSIQTIDMIISNILSTKQTL